MMIPLSEAKTKLFELVRNAADEDVVLLRHGRPAAMLIAPERFDALLDEIEDLRDRLSVYEVAEPGLRVSLDKMNAELGL